MFSRIAAVFLGAILCASSTMAKLDIVEYLKLADEGVIYPSEAQIELLKTVVPEGIFQPAPSISDREFWEGIAATDSGKQWLEMASSKLEMAPEVPISDAIYRKAGLNGDRMLYKPRYYDTMKRLEAFMLAECLENEGRFLPQVEIYVQAILDMKSWVHPNHDKRNDVLDGKRISIDLGARKFGSDMALVKVLLEDRLPETMRKEIDREIQRRIVDVYLTSCQTGDRNCSWIDGTSNWNSVCTSGSVFTTIAGANQAEQRLGAVGSALNSMAHYLSGFDKDGYCSEGIGYWGYGFGHYLYLAEILHDYTDGQIDLFEWDGSDKLKNVGTFPEKAHIQHGNFPAFSDSKPKVSNDGGHFAKALATKHYGSQWPYDLNFEDAIERMIHWKTPFAESPKEEGINLADLTFFREMGVVVSRGKQDVPLSIAIKAGHNAENHNHDDVGSYSLMLGEDFPTRDIGSASYNAMATATNQKGKARNSWGHSVPRINNTLQSRGREFEGRILETEFLESSDRVVMDILPAYELPVMESLVRTMLNDKSGVGTIVVTDEFVAKEAVTFGTAIMTYAKYDILDSNTIILTTEHYRMRADIVSKGGALKIVDEVVPVILGSFKTAYRIGVDFVDPLEKGSISIRYTPLDG